MFPHMGVGSFLSLVWYSTNGIVSFAFLRFLAFSLLVLINDRTGPTATPRSPAKE